MVCFRRWRLRCAPLPRGSAVACLSPEATEPKIPVAAPSGGGDAAAPVTKEAANEPKAPEKSDDEETGGTAPSIVRERKPPPAAKAALLGPRLPPPLVAAVKSIERRLDMSVCLLMLPERGVILDDRVARVLIRNKRALAQDGRGLAVLIDSPGGVAASAFRIASALRSQFDGFEALVPRSAKSAATLVALGADRILMGEDAELGPLDVQITDFDREVAMSALDEVQSVERLHAAALVTVDEMLVYLNRRWQKKVSTSLPHVLKYVADFMRPLMESIDAIQFTQMSRDLKVAEEYAIRLLAPIHGAQKAVEIANLLVNSYPEHGFPILAEEAGSLGLQVEVAEDVRSEMEAVAKFGGKVLAVGPIIEEEENGDGDEDEAGSEAV